jgi:glyoxylate reductase
MRDEPVLGFFRRWGNTMKKKVLVTGDSVSDVYLDKLRKADFEIDNPVEFLESDKLIRFLADKTAYLCGGDEKATADVLKKSLFLRHYAFLGVGYDSFIDVSAATKLGIAITNTPGTLTTSVVELTIGMLLDASRQITFLNNTVKKGGDSPEKLYDLEGRTLGIVGMGDIGTEIARRMNQAFRMKILYHNRKPKQPAPDFSATYTDLPPLLKASDVVLLMLPGNDTTYGLIGEREIRLMKDGVLLINTSRANLVVPDALLGALNSGKVRTAAFDGYFVEPLPEPAKDPYGFLGLPDNKFLITPHIASLTHDARDRMSERCIQSIITFSNTGSDQYIVNPDYKVYAK